MAEAAELAGGCRLCDCVVFEPNQWRNTLCRHCFHGESAHVSGSGDDAAAKPLAEWWFAKVEGPFTWEQMKHWSEAGYFAGAELLVRCVNVGGEEGNDTDTRLAHWQSLQDAFPDKSKAFLPPTAPTSSGGGGQAATPGGRDDSADVGAAASSAAVVANGNGDRVDESGTASALAAEASDDAEERAQWMGKYFAAGQQWYFLDADGERQGPFPGDTMTAWYKAGYFWNPRMMLCHHGWEAYVTLESVVSAKDDENVVRGTAEALDAAGGDAEAAAAGEDYYAEAEVTHEGDAALGAVKAEPMDRLADNLSALMRTINDDDDDDDDDDADDDAASGAAVAAADAAGGDYVDAYAEGGGYHEAGAAEGDDATAAAEGGDEADDGTHYAQLEAGQEFGGADGGGGTAEDGYDEAAEWAGAETVDDAEGPQGMGAAVGAEVDVDGVEVEFHDEYEAQEGDGAADEGVERDAVEAYAYDAAAEDPPQTEAGAEAEADAGADGAGAEGVEGAVAGADDDQWYYADENGDAQGPFTGQQMLDWLSWSYFEPATLVRHASCDGPGAAFVGINVLFPDTETAFFDPGWRARYDAANA